jgi:molybdopterin synthase catalytic subunit
MVITVRYFAAHRDITGRGEEQLELSAGATVATLWEVLAARYPRLQGYQGKLLYAVNEEFSTLATELLDGDEVAFIPPVSGGTPELFVVTNEPLDATQLPALVSSPEMGAVVTFAGIVRNNFDGRATAYLEYEAFEPMAVKVLRQIAEEARERWGTGAIAVHHRIGRLEIGETAVVIVVGAPHRHEAFEAAEWIMDRIKAIAPIWKKEQWADGASEWVGDENERKVQSDEHRTDQA